MIFLKNRKVPVAVAGVQMVYSKLKDYFLSKTNDSKENCSNPNVDCYLISSNGYVIVSARSNEDVSW